MAIYLRVIITTSSLVKVVEKDEFMLVVTFCEIHLVLLLVSQTVGQEDWYVC